MIMSLIPNYSFAKSTFSVLFGTSLGLFTPFMIGDYGGRVKEFSWKVIPKALFLNFYNSQVQNWVIGLFVLPALILVKSLYFPWSTNTLVYCIGVLLAVYLFVLLFDYQRFSIIDKEGYLGKTLKFSKISFSLKIIIFLFTILRNMVYLIQYYLVFKSLGLEVAILDIYAFTSVSLFVKTFSSGLMVFNEVGIRAMLLSKICMGYGMDLSLIVFIFSLITILNVFFPAIVGYILNFRSK
ncbi:MAG: hypothetical protein ACRCVT_09535 [Leadbetterella sp.]